MLEETTTQVQVLQGSDHGDIFIVQVIYELYSLH